MSTVCEGKLSKKVCVIGAGAAGLVSARELRKEGHRVVVFEQNHDVGGQWLYDPHVEDEVGQNPLVTKVHSSIYDSLRINVPREVTGFSDFPFVVKKGGDERRYPGHREMLEYLEDFAEWFGLKEMIRFDTKVEYVGMVDYGVSGKQLKWLVRNIEKNSETSSPVEELFDAVVVANGHYTQPLLPDIIGMDSWKGMQMHSHIYRTPHLFRDKVVVVVGCSISGPEICLELKEVAKEVHLSAKSVDVSEGLSKLISNTHNFHLRPQIQSLHEDGGVMLVDGSCIFADIILYCTGYSYSFPFLDTGEIVGVDDNRVGPLYEHTFPPLLAPSLSFVAINKQNLPFVTSELQARWIAKVLSGRKTLPLPDEMMRSIEQFYHSKEIDGVPIRKTHIIGLNFQFYDRFADYCGSPHLQNWRKELMVSSVKIRMANLETFRDSWDNSDKELLEEADKSFDNILTMMLQ